jgi:transposase-like protein
MLGNWLTATGSPPSASPAPSPGNWPLIVELKIGVFVTFPNLNRHPGENPFLEMMFYPKFCPNPSCTSRRTNSAFRFKRRGHYQRKCDGRKVQRFHCLECNTSFSSQTFRTDYRWHKPSLHLRVFEGLVSKTSLRQMARILEVRRPTIERRFRRLGKQAKDFHLAMLRRANSGAGINGVFQLDEQETFEIDRRLRPVTFPVLIERSTYFVVHGQAAPMGSRGRLTPKKQKQRIKLEAEEGRRKSGSRGAVLSCFQALSNAHEMGVGIDLQTDKKSSYNRLFKKAVGNQFASHQTVSGRAPRCYGSILFPINHTLAMMRDGISRLVRRSWCVSKLRSRLEQHFWVWVAYRNYIRGITVKTSTTPAQALGVTKSAWTKSELTRWRWPELMMN